MATAEVEMVLVALAQPEGNVSSAGMLEPQEARAQSWRSGSRKAQVESWTLRGAQPTSWVLRGGTIEVVSGARWKSMKHTTRKS
jgi:hypothetical protein